MQAAVNAVESYRRARLVDGVTSDDDKPAAVYKLDEICDLLAEATNDVIREVAQYIAQRLEDRSPYVKQKALRLIRYALPRTPPQFRREIQSFSAAMKALFHFRAPPDPLKGDAPSRAVREAAHEAVHALFNPEPPPQRAPRGVPGAGGIGSGGGTSGGGPRKMEGFGNTAPPRPQGTGAGGSVALNSVLEYGSGALQQGLAMISGGSAPLNGGPRKFGPSVDSEGEQRGAYRGPSIHEALHSGDWEEGGPGQLPPRSSRYGGSSNQSWGMERDFGSGVPEARGDPYRGAYSPGGGQRLGDWDSGEGSATHRGGRGVGEPSLSGAFQEARHGVVEGGGLPSRDAYGGEVRHSSEASQLVESLSSAGGVRVQPSREALAEFVARAERLRSADVVDALQWRLRDHSWQVRFKTLCLLEALLRRASEGGPGTQHSAVGEAVKHEFTQYPDWVGACIDSPQASLRDKGRKVLDLLGLGDGGPPTSPAPASAPVATPQDLLPDLLDTTEPASTGPAPARSQDGLADLLGAVGDGGADCGGTTHRPGEGDEGGESLFAGMSLSEQATVQGPSGHSQSMVDPFADLTGPLTSALSASEGPSGAMQPLHDVSHDLLSEDVNGLFEGLSVSAAPSAPASGPKPSVAAGPGSHEAANKADILKAYAAPRALAPGAVPVPSPVGPGLIGAGMGPASVGMPGSMAMPGQMGPVPAMNVLAYQQMLLLQQQQMAMAMQMQGAGGLMPQYPGQLQGGIAGAAAGTGGGGALDPFDFTPQLSTSGGTSGHTTAAAPAPALKEETHAFDFVSGQLEAARSRKKALA